MILLELLFWFGLVVAWGHALQEKPKPYKPPTFREYVGPGVYRNGRFHGTYPPNYNEGTHLISGKGPT